MNGILKVLTAILGVLAVIACLATIGIVGYSMTNNGIPHQIIIRIPIRIPTETS